MILLIKKIFIISLIALMSCEDEKDDGEDGGSLVGTWELSNMVTMPMLIALAILMILAGL